ncbi:MAG: hypothetical protein CME32_27275 [Gimesia sp.]|uniref:Uncharacterized protein n=1 Tax=Gimesia benthica TaxID=2608982 RepID=A0A6I6AHV1_9PLAN|nr:hypothetical protein [Gimesia benthica]MBN72973.1 hypothetical protein [Gimesia sp.]QGQ25838.1 hypothetical protein F1728_25585 [Gimesia benthica]
MDRCLPFLILTQLVFSISASSTTDAAETRPLTIKEINQIWQQRRERLQAMKVELSLEMATSKLLLYPEEETPVNQPSAHAPLTKAEMEHLKKELVINHARYSILLDSPRIRYRYWGRFPSDRLKKTVSFDINCFSDGQTVTRLHQSQGTPSIHIFKIPETSDVIFSLSQLPLRWALLAGDRNLGETLKGFTVRNKTEPILNLDCTVLERTDSEGTASLWIAPKSHDCTVLKYEYHNTDKLLVSSQIQYKIDKQWGQVPTTCELKCFYGNENLLRNSYKFTFDAFHVNESITAEEFLVKFLQGARVWDSRKRDADGKVIPYTVKQIIIPC